MSGYLKHALHYRLYPDSKRLMFERIDEFFKLLKAKKIGRPVAVDYSRGFFQMLEVFRTSYYRKADYAKHTIGFMYVFDRYHNDVSYKDRKKKFMRYLKKAYLVARNSKDKRRLIIWISNYYINSTSDKNLASSMESFIRMFSGRRYKEYMSQSDLKYFVRRTKKQLSKTLPLYKYKSQRKRRIKICIEHNLKCEGLLPTLAECKRNIFSRKYRVSKEHMQYLLLMGTRARSAESTIVNFLERTNRQSFSGSTNVMRIGVQILGNLKTRRRASIKILIKLLNSRRYKVAKDSVDALANIGRPAIRYMTRELFDARTSVQIKLVNAFQKMGKKARGVRSVLRKLKRETSNQKLHDYIDDALRDIR